MIALSLERNTVVPSFPFSNLLSQLKAFQPLLVVPSMGAPTLSWTTYHLPFPSDYNPSD